MPDDPLDELARKLRQGVGREINDDAATDEVLTELQRLRNRRIADTLRSAMHRGDRVTVTVGDMRLTHRLVAVGIDYVTLEADNETVDVRLESAVVTITAATSGGATGLPPARTLRSRLAELEHEASPVEILVGSQRIQGVISVAASDHVIITNPSLPDRSSIVPTELIEAVFSRGARY